MHLNHDILQNIGHLCHFMYTYMYTISHVKNCGLKVGDKDHPLINTPQISGRKELILICTRTKCYFDLEDQGPNANALDLFDFDNKLLHLSSPLIAPFSTYI